MRTARLLNGRGVDPDRLAPAMILDELAHHPDHPHIPPDEIERIATEVRAAVDPTNAHIAPIPAEFEPGLLSPGDHLLVDRLTRSGHLAEAARVLADAGLDAVQARGVLRDYDVDDSHIDATLTETHHNAASGRSEPLWPAERHAGHLRGNHSAVARPPHDVIQRVAAGRNSLRLVQLNEAYAIDSAASIRVWSDAGLAPDVVAGAAIAACDGNVAEAVGILRANWTGEPIDWTQVAADAVSGVAGDAGLSTADSILREWHLVRQTVTGPSPEMS